MVSPWGGEFLEVFQRSILAAFIGILIGVILRKRFLDLMGFIPFNM